MRTLSLLRHAKSSWDDPQLPDFDRPLAPRGLAAAPRMGARMRDLALAPELALCSPAARTRETARLVLPALAHSPPIVFEQVIYEATTETLLTLVRQLPDSVRHALLIGHNPGLHHLILDLLGDRLPPEYADLHRNLPTSALAVLEFPVERWANAAPGIARLVHYETPRSLDA